MSATERTAVSGARVGGVDRSRAIGVLLIVVSAFSFGSGALFAKPVYAAGVDWLTLLAWRFLFAAVLSWGWLLIWPDQRAAIRRMSRRRVLVLILLGILYLGNSGTYFAGLETVSASLAALVVYIYPALVAVISLRFGQSLRGRRSWLALALATAGVALAVGGIDANAAPPLLGLVLVIASPIIYAAWIVLAARLGGDRSDATDAAARREPNAPPHDAEVAAATEQTDSSPAAAVMLTATAIGWWGLALGLGRPVLPGQIPGEAWIPLIGLGVVATAIALQTFYAGTQRIGPAQASLVSTVEPVYTITLAALLLHETLTVVQLLGGIMVIVGVLIAQTGQREPTAT